MHVCIFSLYTFHLFLLSRQALIAMWTILISKSRRWLLKPKRSTSTLHHNKFTYYVFFCFLQTVGFWSIFTFIQKLISKVGDHSRGWPEGSLFDSLLHQGVGEGATPFPGLLHFTLDPYLIMLSVKQGGIKYHFSSLWYDSTWDWTQISRAIGEFLALKIL